MSNLNLEFGGTPYVLSGAVRRPYSGLRRQRGVRSMLPGTPETVRPDQHGVSVRAADVTVISWERTGGAELTRRVSRFLLISSIVSTGRCHLFFHPTFTKSRASGQLSREFNDIMRD